MKIRNKLFVAFMTLVIIILIVGGIVGHYTLSMSHKAVLKVESVADEIVATGDLQHALDKAAMPANHYLVSGDRRHLADFDTLSVEMERRFKDVKEVLSRLDALQVSNVRDETQFLRKIEVSWLNIKDISFRIFNIPDPVGSKEGAALIEEMDKAWVAPASEMIHAWHELDLEEYKTFGMAAEKTGRTSWIIMGATAILLLSVGGGFALYYSRILVMPIEAVHRRADEIARGDFSGRVKIKTGDEIERLADVMNEMADQLQSFYSSLEERVRDRTMELSESEERYRSLFDNMLEGYAYCKMISEDGVPEDFVIIRVNNAFESVTGLKDIVGKRVSEIIPGVRESNPELFQIYSRVASTGTPEKFETYVNALGIWLSVAVYSPDKDYFITVVDNITEKKNAEKILRQQLDELLRFQTATIQRDLKMKELKERLHQLESELVQFRNGQNNGSPSGTLI